MFKVEIGNATEVNKEDSTYPSENWKALIECETSYECLEYIIVSLNNNNLNCLNSWLRLVETRNVVITF